LTKAPENEKDQTSLCSTEVTHVQGQAEDENLVKESEENKTVSPSEETRPEVINPSEESKNAEVPVLSSDITCPAEPPLTSLPRQEPLRPSPSPLKDASLPPLEAKAVLACASPLPKPTAIVKPCLPPPPSPPISPCKTADADGVLPPPADITVMTTLSADSSIVTPIKSQEVEEEERKEVSNSSAAPVSDFKVTENSSGIEQDIQPAKDSSHDMMSEQAVGEVIKEEEEDVPVPPAKGYNLDFLDNLDDPNFNPFETKTAVLNNFDSSAPVSVGESPVKAQVTSAPGETEDAPKPENKPKKPPMRKPLVRKPLLRKPVKKPDPVEEKPTEDAKDEEDDLPAVPKKSYNMDFLDQLDDPKFNPFETKTAVKEQFDTSAPVDVPVKTIDEAPSKKVPESVENKAEESEKPMTKPVAKKPWLKKPVLKKKVEQPPPPVESDPAKDEEEDAPVPAAKGYNLDFLDKLDDPNFNPFETKTAVIDMFDSSAPQETNHDTEKSTSQEQDPSNVQAKEEPTPDQNAEEESKVKKPIAKKPWLKKPPLRREVKNEEAAKVDEEVEEERVPVPGKAYNLDFLDKLDDPNFNPFETKSSVTNAPNVDTMERLSENDKTLDLQQGNDGTSDDQTIVNGLKDDTPGFEATEALVVGSPPLPTGDTESSNLRAESPSALAMESSSLPVEGSPISQQSSGYSSLPRSTQQLLAQPPAADAEDLSLW